MTSNASPRAGGAASKPRGLRSIVPCLLAAVVLAASSPAAEAQKNVKVNILPLKLTGIAVSNGQLIGQFKLGKTTFTAPINLSATPNAADPTCPSSTFRWRPST